MGAGRFIRDLRKQVREGKKDKNKKRRSLPGSPAPRDKPKSKPKPKPNPKPNPKKTKADDGAPVATYSDGSQLVGAYGKRVPRTKGDFREINKAVYDIKKKTRQERDQVTDDVRGMNPQQRQDYLDRFWINNENRIEDLRSQYLLYGKNSVQGRLLDQTIKGAVNLQNHVERLAGVRNDRAGYQDYFSIPKPDGRKRVRGIDRFGKPQQLPSSPYSGPRDYVNRMHQRDANNGIYYKGVDYNQPGSD